MGNPNWARLFAQGRCKAVGVPWSDEEANAVYNLHIPVEYVRDGIVTEEEYEAVKAEDMKKGTPAERMDINQLRERATELKVDFTPHTPHSVLLNMVQKAEKPAPKKAAKKATKTK